MHSKISGELSPSYLFYADIVARRIHDFNPACKIVILLREPISRALSQHSIFIGAKREFLSFDAAICAEQDRQAQGWEYAWAYRSLGLYAAGVNSYLTTFGVDQVWVGLYDDLSAGPQTTFDSICDFLEVRRHSIPESLAAHQSPISVGPLRKLSRTAAGAVARKIAPRTVLKWARNLDRKFDSRISGGATFDQLRSLYRADVEALDQLLPTLNLRRRWRY